MSLELTNNLKIIYVLHLVNKHEKINAWNYIYYDLSNIKNYTRNNMKI
jgi:hypothetical protein